MSQNKQTLAELCKNKYPNVEKQDGTNSLGDCKVLTDIIEQCVTHRFDLEKFAELIIRECISLCDDHSESKILEHFGLEETRQCF